MATTEQLEQLMQDVSERMEALAPGELAKNDEMRAMVVDVVKELAEDDDFSRKMRFGKGDAPELIGTKYGRRGLGIEDLEFMYTWLTANNIARNKSGPTEELQRVLKTINPEFQNISDNPTEFERKEVDKAFIDLPAEAWATREELRRGVPYYESQAYQRAQRDVAHDTGESGYGAEIVGVGYGTSMWMAPRREDVIFPLIQSFEMRYPTEYLPVAADIPEMYFVAENTSFQADGSNAYPMTQAGSNRVAVAAKKFAIPQVWAGEMSEDSLIPYVPFLRAQQAISLQFYRDSLILNGDTTDALTGNINSDDANPADTKHYLAFDGIRHAWLVDATGQGTNHAGAAISYAALVNLRSNLIDRGTNWDHDWGHPTMPNDLVYVANPELVEPVSLLTEVLTVDKYGQNATVLQGEVARIGRNPFLVTPAVKQTEADGKVSATPANNTLNQVNLFNTRGFVSGARRRITTEMVRLPWSDQWGMVTYVRIGFGRFTATGAVSGIKAAGGLYNIA